MRKALEILKTDLPPGVTFNQPEVRKHTHSPGLNQDFETGFPKLAVVQFLGILFFKRDSMKFGISFFVTLSAILRLSHDYAVVAGGGNRGPGENHRLTPSHWQLSHMPQVALYLGYNYKHVYDILMQCLVSQIEVNILNNCLKSTFLEIIWVP